jgi:hypothetical protein
MPEIQAAIESLWAFLGLGVFIIGGVVLLVVVGVLTGQSLRAIARDYRVYRDGEPLDWRRYEDPMNTDFRGRFSALDQRSNRRLRPSGGRDEAA